MPEEVFVLALFSVLAGTGLVIFVVLQIASIFKSRTRRGDASITTTELEDLVGRVVSAELKSVRKRLDRLEKDDERVKREARLLDVPSEDQYIDDRGEANELRARIRSRLRPQ